MLIQCEKWEADREDIDSEAASEWVKESERFESVYGAQSYMCSIFINDSDYTYVNR